MAETWSRRRKLQQSPRTGFFHYLSLPTYLGSPPTLFSLSQVLTRSIPVPKSLLTPFPPRRETARRGGLTSSPCPYTNRLTPHRPPWRRCRGRAPHRRALFLGPPFCDWWGRVHADYKRKGLWRRRASGSADWLSRRERSADLGVAPPFSLRRPP